MKFKKWADLIETELNVSWAGKREKWEDTGQRVKLSVIRTSLEALMYRVVTMVNIMVSCTWKLLKKRKTPKLPSEWFKLPSSRKLSRMLPNYPLRFLCEPKGVPFTSHYHSGLSLFSTPSLKGPLWFTLPRSQAHRGNQQICWTWTGFLILFVVEWLTFSKYVMHSQCSRLKRYRKMRAKVFLCLTFSPALPWGRPVSCEPVQALSCQQTRLGVFAFF